MGAATGEMAGPTVETLKAGEDVTTFGPRGVDQPEGVGNDRLLPETEGHRRAGKASAAADERLGS